jgi:hypothetical protein
MVMMLSAHWRNEAIAPGPLSPHHAELLLPSHQVQRCASCHAAGDATWRQWIAHAVRGEALGLPQSQLCLQCHQQLIEPATSLVAHTLPREVLDALSYPEEPGAAASSRRRDPHQPIACSACHREHQGVHHNLVAIDNQSCQACHRERYHAFATDHPEFRRRPRPDAAALPEASGAAVTAWPYLRPTSIPFDHAAHARQHYAKTKAEFRCDACHVRDATGRHQRTLGYASSCASCHDESIAVSLSDGIALLSLPTIDTEFLEELGQFQGTWPEEAAGDFDGRPAVMSQVLMASDPQGATALATLGPSFDAYDLDLDDPQQVAAIGQYAEAQRRLVLELAEEGQEAIRRRLETLLQRELTAAQLRDLTANLSPDVLSGFRQRWFGETPADRPPPADRTSLRAQTPAGGWVRDDPACALVYRATGHADPLLRAWIDLLCELAAGPHQPLAEAWLPQLVGPQSAGQCRTCHTLEQHGHRWSITWELTDPTSKPRGLTFFNHGPHVMQPRLSDCQTCHQLASPAVATAGEPQGANFASATGFGPLGKAACASCHTPHAAGDHCTQCHHYHVASPQPFGAFPAAVSRNPPR